MTPPRDRPRPRYKVGQRVRSGGVIELADFRSGPAKWDALPADTELVILHRQWWEDAEEVRGWMYFVQHEIGTFWMADRELQRIGKRKVLTLHQPWASLVAWGAKRIETRSWPTTYRGPLAIHAAQEFPRYARKWLEALCEEGNEELLKPFRRGRVGDLWADEIIEALPFGALLCTCRLTDCLPTEKMHRANIAPSRFSDPWGGYYISEQEYRFGDYRPERFAFLLADIEELPQPIPARGYQRLWETDLV
jgi:activating signal cointegrator 1